MRYTVSPIVGRLLWPAWLRVLFAPAAVSRRFQSFPAGADDRYVSARAHMVHHVAAAQVLRAIEQEPAQVG